MVWIGSQRKRGSSPLHLAGAVHWLLARACPLPLRRGPDSHTREWVGLLLERKSSRRNGRGTTNEYGVRSRRSAWPCGNRCHTAYSRTEPGVRRLQRCPIRPVANGVAFACNVLRMRGCPVEGRSLLRAPQGNPYNSVLVWVKGTRIVRAEAEGAFKNLGKILENMPYPVRVQSTEYKAREHTEHGTRRIPVLVPRNGCWMFT